LQPTSRIDYPESDGKPIADTSRQFDWIVKLANNLQALFHNQPDVFVCGDQFWYPVEGQPAIRNSPDVYVIFGRPKGDRSSYKQWEEDNLPMTVVFEILSPNMSGAELADKFSFYEKYGVEEYYIYDPETNLLDGYIRRGEILLQVPTMNHFVSHRLGIRFDLSGPELVVRYPDGRPFLTFVEAMREYTQAKQRVTQAEQRATQAEQWLARLNNGCPG
jgi:Uma2 family endonuclease